MKAANLCNPTPVMLRSLWAVALAGTLALAPLTGAVAQDQELPDPDGTSYGAMIQELEAQLDRLDAAPDDEQVEALRETVRVLAQQNLTMIRMFDTMHDSVDGLLQAEAERAQPAVRHYHRMGSHYGQIRGRPAARH